MSELNAEQIKKALACCLEDVANCNNCPYERYCDMHENNMLRDTLTLITSQEQRIKELTEENERLKTQKYMAYPDGRLEMIPTVESVKADTVREMQEALCEGRVSNDPVVIAVNVVAKEMVEEDKNND